MKWTELGNNQELFNKLVAEAEQKIRAGQPPLDAKIEVLKAHDIEFDEDALRAAEVNAMELDPESLKNVSGGTHEYCGDEDYFCWADYSCYDILKHGDSENNHLTACFADYYCIFILGCAQTL